MARTRIRRAGGLPVYPDLSRETAIYSALMMSKADVIINAAPQSLNSIPFFALDYAAKAAWLNAYIVPNLLAQDFSTSQANEK